MGDSRVPRSITETYLAQYRAVIAQSDDSAALFPLTGAQRRFLLTSDLGPGRCPDIVPLFFTFPKGTVDVARLRSAALRFASRHTALRGSVTVVRGTPALRLGPPSVEVREVSAGTTVRNAVRAELGSWRAGGPVLRLLLARGPDEEDELLAIVLDHVVCDERALGIVTAGLTEAYTEDIPHRTAPEDAAAYRDAVTRQLAAEEEASRPAHLDYWATRLSVLTNQDPVHPGATSPPDDAADNGMLSHRLPAPEGMRGSVFPVLLDAVSVVLRKGAGVPALGYTWGGRPPGTPEILGCFLNTVVHPVREQAVSLEETAAMWWDDLEHADTPYDEVLRAVRREGASWSGSLDGFVVFEDLGRRPPLTLGGTPGREVHLTTPRRYAAPLAVAFSLGEDLLVRVVWDRGRLADDDARAAGTVLLHTLRHHLDHGADQPTRHGTSRSVAHIPGKE
ncbi:hypothetical protein [Actinophytocola sp.]|uniref:hypothetical protein n=1 Tax=Actinophytocola sp. TaxID=1872138 RepID=UPI002ED35205